METCTWWRSPPPSRRRTRPYSWSIRPAGTCRRDSVVPPNITIMALPPKCPELSIRSKNVWQFQRDNWLSNRVFKILRRSRRPLLRGIGNNLVDQPLANHVHRIAPMGPPVSAQWDSVTRENVFFFVQSRQLTAVMNRGVARSSQSTSAAAVRPTRCSQG